MKAPDVTANVMASAPRTGRQAGLVVDRMFTKPGVDPFSQVTWGKRRSEIKSPDGKKTIFVMEDVEAPEGWSQVAVDIAADKYFRKAGVPGRGHEHSVRQIVTRVAEAIRKAGERLGGYFASEKDAQAFEDELKYMLVTQHGAFNSPVFFNVGLAESYGINGKSSGNFVWDFETGTVKTASESYAHPAASACFIVSVEDDLLDIAKHVEREMRIFRFGGGSGGNFSRLRAEGESLSNGGVSSGLMSFLKVFDVSAGAIKSGGTCLAPTQRVYTERGPVAVKELAEKGEDFIVLSYDPPAGRYKAKTARAWRAGRKKVMKIVTDKGEFDLTYDHPVKLASEEAVKVEALKPGMSLFACTVDIGNNGPYLRVGLRDGAKGRMRFSRMIAQDVMGLEIEGYSIHHKDENTFNNHPSNLERKLQSDHARDHNDEYVAAGEHVFQEHSFPHDGANNGMHSSSDFWADEEKVSAYKAKQGGILKASGRAAIMQRSAGTQRMLNLGYRIINAGRKIDTFEQYWVARREVIGPIGTPKAELMASFNDRFGSYENFVKELLVNNHRVVSVTDLGEMDVYDVEVDCPTDDDKSPESGHNFVIWSGSEFTGSGIAVHNTRRAAKLVCLDADHPDIEKFIDWKVKEEDKALALIKAGYPSDFNGEAYATVSGQNANNSVRLTDEFMQSVLADKPWQTKWRTTGKVAATLSAKKLFRKIAEAAWRCADPGLMFHTTINRWNTVANTGSIEAANPCVEFHFVSNTACNLSSLNLMKFMSRTKAGGWTFDVTAFRHASRVFTLAKEIIVDYASYPTEAIAQNSHDYRPLGLGYANLGASLMVQGVPYDSEDGLAFAAAVNSVLCGVAYETSAEIAASKGPFPGFAHNREPMLKVLGMHRDAAHAVKTERYRWIAAEGRRAWDAAVQLADRNGVRNAQVTVTAPTGTIGLMMDCDTTGIEPDFSLVKAKKMAGGGFLKIVNQSVDAALETLGYTQEQRAAYVKHVLEHGTLETAPGIKPEHLAVFDCANRSGEGTRFIEPMGHIRMLAAVQPFVSGSISKTVNVPEATTVEEIENLYMEAWKRGLKCVAIYRDNSKHSQPLSSSSKKGEKKETDAAAAAKVAAEEPMLPSVKHHDDREAKAPPQTRRHRLRKDRHDGVTQELSVGSQKIYVRTGEYADGSCGEVFIDMHKAGATMRSMLNCYAVAVSLGLQHGVPLREFVNAFCMTKFDPAGPVDHPHIKMASSIIDAVFRFLGFHYLGEDGLEFVQKKPTETEYADYQARRQLKIMINNAKSPAELLSAVLRGKTDDIHGLKSIKPIKLNGTNGANGAYHTEKAAAAPVKSGSMAEAQTCARCGNLTVRTGTCNTCTGCGLTTGCG